MKTLDELITNIEENIGRADLSTQIRSRLDLVQTDIVNKVASLGFDIPELRLIKHPLSTIVGSNIIDTGETNIRSSISLEMNSKKLSFYPFNIFMSRYNMATTATGMPTSYTLIKEGNNKILLDTKANAIYTCYFVASMFAPSLSPSGSIIYGIDDALISGTTARIFKAIESPSANDWFQLYNINIKDYVASLSSIDVWAPVARGYQAVNTTAQG